ncbi:MAG: glycosyltransferase family 2 protein [Lachnospiraceae bacterium]|nr:glycosyltransferase family 2 protein [Lachnospiraceae bacterium]
MASYIVNFIKLNLCFFRLRKQRLEIKEKNRWKKTFLHFLCNISKESSDYSGRWNVIKGFTESDIRLIKKAKNTKNGRSPIVICVLLNEIERLPVLLEHYRRIGIRKFAMIDNGSADGTLDYLRKQKDVDLFQTKDRFESKIKMGWINRVISYYGISKWYLVVDADELLVWQGIENINIQDVVKYLDKKNITRARALMVDMYPREEKWDTDGTFEEVYPACNYFDHDTYVHQESEELYLMCGGPRGRKLGITAWLTKYPLFRLEKNEFLCNPHVIYPYEKRKTPCYLAVLHYKFLTRDDQRKMRKYARKGNYINNSAEYKLYVKKYQENADNFNFYYNGSAEYESSYSLEKISELDKIPLHSNFTDSIHKEKT